MNFIVKLNSYRVDDMDILTRLNPPSINPIPKTKKTSKGKNTKKPTVKHNIPKHNPLLIMFDTDNVNFIEDLFTKHSINDIEKFTLDDLVLSYIGGYNGDEINIQLGNDGNFYINYVNYNLMKNIWFSFNRETINELFKCLTTEDISTLEIVEENLEDIMKKGGK
jgi:hypothetical protein